MQGDHLATPRVITDTSGNTVWQWDNSDPFGNNMANENLNGAGQFAFNLRFPGQYFDRETNLHYNVNRDYDSAIGAIVEFSGLSYKLFCIEQLREGSAGEITKN